MLHKFALRAGAACALLAFTSSTVSGTPLCRNGEPASAELFTDWWCPTCDEARLFLFRHGIPFIEYHMQEEANREKLYRRSGRGTTPSIFMCSTWVFGFGGKQESELRELVNVQSAVFQR